MALLCFHVGAEGISDDRLQWHVSSVCEVLESRVGGEIHFGLYDLPCLHRHRIRSALLEHLDVNLHLDVILQIIR